VNGGISQFARGAGRWIPDATAAAVLMLFGLGAAALARPWSLRRASTSCATTGSSARARASAAA
jgi:hypothetical protein